MNDNNKPMGDDEEKKDGMPGDAPVTGGDMPGDTGVTGGDDAGMGEEKKDEEADKPM